MGWWGGREHCITFVGGGSSATWVYLLVWEMALVEREVVEDEEEVMEYSRERLTMLDDIVVG